MAEKLTTELANQYLEELENLNWGRAPVEGDIAWWPGDILTEAEEDHFKKPHRDYNIKAQFTRGRWAIAGA